MNTLNTIMTAFYTINLIICGLSFTALFLTIFYNTLKAVKNFIF